MAEIIALIIFVGSLCGIGVILFKKIPAIKELPIEREKKSAEYFSGVEEKIKQVNPKGFTCFEKFLKKFLMRIRIFGLKMENAVQGLLKRIRERPSFASAFAKASADKKAMAGKGKNEFLDDSGEENIGKDDIENIKNELKNKIETESEQEPEPEIELELDPKIEKDNYWEELKKFKKKKITRPRRKAARKKKN